MAPGSLWPANCGLAATGSAVQNANSTPAIGIWALGNRCRLPTWS